MGENQIPQPASMDSSASPQDGGVIPEVMGRVESVEQFRELMAHLQQVFWIKTAEKNGVIYVSPAYEKIWGRSRQSLYDDFQTLVKSIHPDDRACTGWDHRMRANMEAHGEEFRILRPDGEIRWIKSQSYPVRNKEGEIQRYAGIDEDITDQKASEKERSRLAAIVEYSDDALVSMSIDGIIINWNHGAERQYGYSAEEIIGHSISVLFPPDRYEEYLCVLKKIKQGEPLSSYETVRQRKDGTLINISISISPIENRSGEIVGASKIGHDLTRIKKMEAQFIEAQKMEVVGQLAGGVAHDFNNILAVVIGYNDLITESLGADHPLLKYTEEIRLAAERASGLTRQLLIFSRKEAVKAVVLNLNEVVESMDKMLRRFIDENMEMSLVCGEDIGQIKADSGYIGQVLMNLVVNARDAMPNGGKLEIETSAVTLDPGDPRLLGGAVPGNYVVLRVTDTGMGMTEEIKARLFEAFFTTKGLGKGTGLGLTTCQTIVRQSGGFIEVSSEVGKGTTFRIYFPRVNQPIDPQIEARKTRSLRQGTETLLLVEDEPALRQLAQSALKIMGYQVLLAANGQDGLNVARDHQGAPIRLVITDVIMPKMGGKVMVEWLKTTHPDLKVLFTSGYNDDAIMPQGVLNEGIEFLPKPYTHAALARKVREMLDTP
jgi:two-component system cell cycle sensor histidine kinase/response regulator CckA